MTDTNENNVDFFAPSTSLYAFNFPKALEHIPRVEEQDFLQLTYKSYRRLGTLNLDNPRQSVLAYYSNGPILALERQTYDIATRKYLNQFGLKIFLTEPLCSHIIDDPKGEVFFHNFNFGFYSEFYNDKMDPKLHRAKELDSIFKHIRENALTNVTVATCDYGVNELYPLYKDYMKLTYEDLFIKDIRIYDNISMVPKTEITKKFICPTWRYTTARWLASSLLQDMDCYLSWYFAAGTNFGEGSTWATKNDFEKYAPELYDRHIAGAEALNKKVPLCIDIKASQATFIPNGAAHHYPEHLINKKLEDGMNPIAINEVHQPLEKLYQHTFLSIQAESRFAQPTGNWSEKVIQAIQYKTPFVLLAPPYTLKCMKEFGYRTFDKWWDESYDNEENHLIRFKKIFEILDWIETLPYEELTKMYHEMENVLEHNFRQAIDNTQTGTMSSAIDPDNAVSISWDSEWSKVEFVQK